MTDDEVAHAMRLLYRTTHNLAEGAGAAALAAAMQIKDSALVKGRRSVCRSPAAMSTPSCSAISCKALNNEDNEDNEETIMRTLTAVTTWLTAAALTGCAPQIEGSYVDQEGAPAFRLMNGKYYGTSVDASEARPARWAGGQIMPIALPYKVDGERLIVQKAHGVRVLYIMPDLALRQPDSKVRYVRRVTVSGGG